MSDSGRSKESVKLRTVYKEVDVEDVNDLLVTLLPQGEQGREESQYAVLRRTIDFIKTVMSQTITKDDIIKPVVPGDEPGIFVRYTENAILNYVHTVKTMIHEMARPCFEGDLEHCRENFRVGDAVRRAIPWALTRITNIMLSIISINSPVVISKAAEASIYGVYMGSTPSEVSDMETVKARQGQGVQELPQGGS